MFRYTKSSKRGFTLLETMLAVALLLIVTLISYEGFMTTLNYAGDTALADRVSNVNAGNCYKTMGQATSSLHGGTASKALMIKGPGYTGVIQVHEFDRHGFVYIARACTQSGHGILGFYEETDASGNKVYVAKCTEPGCTYSAKFS